MNTTLAECPDPQPIYLLNAFWGVTYRDYFCDVCLPSILSPGNVAGLDAAAANALLIATTAEDWAAIQQHPAIEAARAHFRLVHHVIPPANTAADKFARVALAYAALCEIAHADRACGLILCPDHILGEGSLPYLRGRMEAGVGVVFLPTWRSDETKLFAALKRRGGDHDKPVASLAIANRDLAAACLESLHEFEDDKFWDSPVFSASPGNLFWRVGDAGLLALNMSGMPMVNFARVTRHDINGLGAASFDAYPSMLDVGDAPVEMVDDTDKALIASWTPSDESRPVHPVPLPTWPGCYDLIRIARLRTYARHVFIMGRNRLNQAVFNTPIRIHAQDLDARWDKAARDVVRLMAWSVGDMLLPGAAGAATGAPVGRPLHPWWMVMRLATLVFAGRVTLRQNLHYLREYSRALHAVLRGDPVFRGKLMRKLGLGRKS